ncbi:hypothetical protein NC651_003709 [Populus alba x Populus x berolinensis]|nr:hypothetical protein NC651_003709 [Populus alba x Populus x berolinensis]
MLIHEYELFKMFPSESITSMFTRITTITNSLDALCRTYTKARIISKNFRSLLKKGFAFKIVHYVEVDNDNDDTDKDENKKELSKEVLKCYKCNKTGHIKVDCPLIQNKRLNHHQKKSNEIHMMIQTLVQVIKNSMLQTCASRQLKANIRYNL